MRYIYKLTSPSLKIYIGQTKDIVDRFDRYSRLDCKGQPKLYNALKKYGFNCFIKEVLCYVPDEEADFYEVMYIQFYNSMNSGYNCDIGGLSGKNRSKETKNKIAETCRKNGIGKWMKGKKRPETAKKKTSTSAIKSGVGKWMTGKKHSEETKRKMSEAQKRRWNAH